MKVKLELRAFTLDEDAIPEGMTLPSPEWKDWVKQHGKWGKLERFVEASMLPKEGDDVLHLRDSVLWSNGLDGWAIVGDELVPVLWLTASAESGELSVIWLDEYLAIRKQQPATRRNCQ
jgi:hypothetical protein